MSMNTPTGGIIQTTAIKDFIELENIDTQQYLLGINNIATGDGSKIKLEKIIEDSISTDTGNTLEIGSDNKLLNIEEDTGVQAGTYAYPQNLVVNGKGKIISVVSGSPASVPIATTLQAGIVKPDGLTIAVLNDGTISVIGLDEIVTDLNGKANVSLSNLSSTGINNLVQYANELDWDNEIVITTSSMSGIGEYSVPSDGVVIACAIGSGTTSNSKRIIAGFFRDNTGTEAGGSNVLPYTQFLTSVAFGHFATTEHFTYMEGDTCYYYARAEGFTNNYVRVSFIPFKKTI